MFKKIASVLRGNFESKEELWKFGFLATIFFLILGIYWILRPLKESLFFALIGREYLWQAKIVSLFVLSPFIVFYGKLVDRYDHQRLFYAFISLYAIGAFCFMWFFMHPQMGLVNTIKGTDRVIGWLWYVFVDSFGVLFVTLFWAFTTDTTTPDSAKRGFPVISLCGQLGNIVGPTFITARKLGFATSGPVIGICAFLMGLTGIVFWLFMYWVPRRQLRGYRPAHEALTTKQEKTSFFEGLGILLTEKYLLGMLCVVMFNEMLMTIFDYHFKQVVGESFPLEIDASAYLATYAQYVGVVSTLCVFFGIHSIQRFFGIKASLVLLPMFIVGAVLSIYWFPSTLKVIFWVMVLSKAINYALHQPTMKQLYIPTTPQVKYKVQAWLEMFGSRGAKSIASLFNSLRGILEMPLFIGLFSMVSVGVLGVWILVALYIAHVYDKAIKENRVIC